MRPNHTAPLQERVAAVIDTMYDGLTAPDSRAIETLRMALPRESAELERLYPKTAAELASWGQSWIQACHEAFADVDVDPVRVRAVAAFLPGRCGASPRNASWGATPISIWPDGASPTPSRHTCGSVDPPPARGDHRPLRVDATSAQAGTVPGSIGDGRGWRDVAQLRLG